MVAGSLAHPMVCHWSRRAAMLLDCLPVWCTVAAYVLFCGHSCRKVSKSALARKGARRRRHRGFNAIGAEIEMLKASRGMRGVPQGDLPEKHLNFLFEMACLSGIFVKRCLQDIATITPHLLKQK